MTGSLFLAYALLAAVLAVAARIAAPRVTRASLPVVLIAATAVLVVVLKILAFA